MTNKIILAQVFGFCQQGEIIILRGYKWHHAIRSPELVDTKFILPYLMHRATH